MSTISASTTSTTAYKVTADTTGTLVFQTGASPTTAMSISSSQIISFTNPPTATGGGGVATNTAYGTSALAANTTGSSNTAIGNSAGYSNQDGTSLTAVGLEAGYSNTSGNNNVFMGRQAGKYTTTSSDNTGIGTAALTANTTGASNTAIGRQALQANTTASSNTAVGYQAGYSNTTGTSVDAFGSGALYANTTGTNNAGFAAGSLVSNTTGSSNSAFGRDALRNNTTANNNTAVGYQAGYSNTTGGLNVFVGRLAGYFSTGASNTCVGEEAGYYTTGTNNTYLGYGAGPQNSGSTGSYNTLLGNLSGYLITTGSKNSILGCYNGNQGSLDIRTLSNKVVLSDGDGNPVAVYGMAPSGAGTFGVQNSWTFGLGGTAAASYEGTIFLNGADTTGRGPGIYGNKNGTNYWGIGSYSLIVSGTATWLAMSNSGGGGVYLNGSSATSWTAVSSDARQKKDFAPVEGLAEVMQVVPTKFRYEWETEADPIHMGFTAQNLLPIIPDMVVIKEELHEDGTPLMTVTPDYMIPVLVKAIQELKAEFDAYKEAHP